jgi:hypothetical protein
MYLILRSFDLAADWIRQNPEKLDNRNAQFQDRREIYQVHEEMHTSWPS